MMTKRTTTLTLLIILVTSCGMTAVFFAPRDIVSSAPVYSDDYSLHFSNALAASKFWLSWGHCWGYDPFLLAGFPRCALVNADNKAWELFVLAFGSLMGAGRAFKAFVLLLLVFYPLLVYGAARNFSLPREQALAGSALSMLFFHLSLPNDFVLWGLVAYIFACFFSIYVLSLMYRLETAFSIRLYLVTAISAAALFPMHILAPVHIFIPAGLLYVLYAGRHSLGRNLLILTIPLIVVAANLFWLGPIFDFISYKTTSPAQYEFALQIKNVLEPFNVYFKQRRSLAPNIELLNNTFIEVVLLLFGISGCCLWCKAGQRRLAAAFGIGIAFIFCVTFYGSHTPFFAQFQPQRFANALNILLLVPAGAGLYSLCCALTRGRTRFDMVVLGCLLFVVLYQPVVYPMYFIARYKGYRLQCSIPSPMFELMRCLERNTTRDGRILIEDSESISGRGGEYEPEAYYATHLPGLLPEYVKREYLCGPRPLYPIKHSFASFTRGVLFERPIETYTLADLRVAFDLFNVKWIVCWFDRTRQLLDRFPEYVRPLTRIDKFCVYEVLREPSFFLKGHGTVHADYNLLELTDLRPEDGEIILSYHWMKHLVTESGVPVERALIGDDPVGFIKIKNPPTALTIRNDY